MMHYFVLSQTIHRKLMLVMFNSLVIMFMSVSNTLGTTETLEVRVKSRETLSTQVFLQTFYTRLGNVGVANENEFFFS